MIPEIFFSYAWGDENEQGESREKIINELYQSLLKDNYRVVRDKNDLGYKGVISDFMGKLGKGQCVVVAISQKFLKSPYCMFELYEIARNSNFDKTQFRNKVLPIIVEFIDLTKPVVIDSYFEYWENQYNEWNNLIEKRHGQLSIEQMNRYDRVRMIYQNFGKLTEWIIDMNTLNPKILSHDHFAAVKEEIQSMFTNTGGNGNVQEPKVGDPKNSGKTITGKLSGPREYKLPNIRKFLEKGLSDDDLNALCMEHFEEVYAKFTAGQNKLQKILLLLDYCKRNIKLDELLDVMQEVNTAQFDLYKPYV